MPALCYSDSAAKLCKLFSFKDFYFLPITAYARVNEEVPSQEPLLRVTTGAGAGARQFFKLDSGKRGNLQTAAIMANLVRDAAVNDKPLELFAAQILVNSGLDSHSNPLEIADVMLRYCQQLTYIHDPAGSFDSVQSARQVISEGKGDCDDLSVLLATLLALVGFKPRFVLAKYKEDSDGFDHVYVDLELPQGRTALDPSSRKHGIGWESSKAIERIAYPIFDGKVLGLGDIAGKVKKLFAGMAGFGSCRGGGGGGCGSCGSTVDGRRSTVSAAGGGSNVDTLGGVSLSLPAVLFSIGSVIVVLKAVDLVTERWS